MAWKKDSNGNLEEQDGNPVWIEEKDGKAEETAIDGGRMLAKISELNGESAGHRRKANELKAELDKYDGLDPVKAREALSTVEKIDQKKLIDAGKVDEVREAVKAEYQKQIEERDTRLATLEAERLADEKLRIFQGSPFFVSPDGEKKPGTYYTPEHALKIWGDRFERDSEGRLVATYPDGKPVVSKKPDTLGDPADPQEAISLLIEADPKKDTFLRGSGMSGTGNPGTPSAGNPSAYDPNASLSDRVEAVRRGVAPAN